MSGGDVASTVCQFLHAKHAFDYDHWRLLAIHEQLRQPHPLRTPLAAVSKQLPKTYPLSTV